jgi:CheY-like chemotaxis protein
MPKILIIDDDEDFKTLIQTYFLVQGHEVEKALNGREGLKKAAAWKPDLILLDVMMPDMNGIEVLRELRAGEETGHVPVFIMTASVFDPKMSEYFRQESNCREYLPKDTNLQLLDTKLKAALAGGPG